MLLPPPKSWQRSRHSALRFTWRLADSTRKVVDGADKELAQGRELLKVSQRQAKAMAQQAKASRAILASSMQPLLVPVVERKIIDDREIIAADNTVTQVQLGPQAKIWRTASDYWAVVPVRNVGSGPALFNEPSLTGDERLNSVIITDRFGGFSVGGRVTSRIVAPNEIVDVVFHQVSGAPSTPGLAPRPDGHPLAAEVRLWYRDLSGEMTHTSISYEGGQTVIYPFDVRVTLAKKLAAGQKMLTRLLSHDRISGNAEEN